MFARRSALSSRHARTAALLTRRHNHSATWPVVDRLNSALSDYPMHSFTAYIGSSLLTFGAATAALSALNFDMPALAVAGLVSKLSKKVRTPIDMAAAATLSHAMPWTNTLKLGPLLSPMQLDEARPGTASGGAREAVGGASNLENKIVGFARWAEGPVNKYGAPYMLAHWCSGLTVVCATTFCVHHGVDVMAALSHLPFLSADDGSAGVASARASCVAGGMVANTLSLPLRLYLLSLFARRGFEALQFERRQEALLRGYRSWLRRTLRTRPELRRLERRGRTRNS